MIRHVIQAGIIVPVAVAGQQPRFWRFSLFISAPESFNSPGSVPYPEIPHSATVVQLQLLRSHPLLPLPKRIICPSVKTAPSSRDAMPVSGHSSVVHNQHWMRKSLCYSTPSLWPHSTVYRAPAAHQRTDLPGAGQIPLQPHADPWNSPQRLFGRKLPSTDFDLNGTSHPDLLSGLQVNNHSEQLWCAASFTVT